MKQIAIALSILFIIVTIGSNALSSNRVLIQDRRESYQACMRLRTKAPYLKLNCENLLEPPYQKKVDKNDIINPGVKQLPKEEVVTRKVGQREQARLRKLLQKLVNEKRKN